MEYQNNKHVRQIHQINQLNLEQKIGSKQVMNHVELIILKVKLDLKLQC